MQRFTGRVALVTGASSGIGAAICRRLTESEMKVIGVARNIQPILELQEQLNKSTKCVNLTPMVCDVTKDDEVYAMFEEIKSTYGGVDVCVNCAGMAHKHSILDGSPDEWRQVMNLNVVAVCLISQLAIKSMIEREVEDGQLINISSLSAHITVTPSPIHFYAASKQALRSVSEGLRLEMKELQKKIRIACISPGVVDTGFFEVQFGDDLATVKQCAHAFQIQQLTAEDIADCAVYIISAPPHVEINDIIVRPVESIA